MQPGQYDQRVAIDRLVRTGDDAGGAAKSWTEVATVWASVWPVSARDQFAAAQVEGITGYRVRMRRRTDVTVAHRLRWVTNGDKAMNITGVLDQGPRVEWIELLCEIGVTGSV